MWVWLAGMGVSEAKPDGDLEAMARLRDLMKLRGTMLLTVPAGQDTVYPPWHRVYGNERLPRLIEGYDIEKEAFWVKDEQNRWQLAERQVALNYKTAAGSWNPLQNIYAFGCFVLRSR